MPTPRREARGKKLDFKQGNDGILLCNDAPAEGLHFQFCGALINDDVPWNPMRVEWRVGRIEMFEQVLGKLPTILVKPSSWISQAPLARPDQRESPRCQPLPPWNGNPRSRVLISTTH